MASFSDMLPQCPYEGNLRRYLCAEHKSCLTHEFTLTKEFMEKHKLDDLDKYDQYDYHEISCFNLFVLDTKILVSENYGYNSDNFLHITFKHSKQDSDETFKQEPYAIALKLANGRVCHFSHTSENSWQFSYTDDDVEHGGAPLLDHTGVLDIHFHVPNANAVFLSDSLANRDCSLLGKQQGCDIFFDFQDGESVGAHTLILSNQSPVFEAMFQHDMLEAKTKRIKVDDAKSNVFNIFLFCLYTRQLPANIGTATIEDLKELLTIGHKYQVEAVVKVVEHKLCKDVEVANVLDLLIFADAYSCEQLTERCLKLMTENSLWKSGHKRKFSQAQL